MNERAPSKYRIFEVWRLDDNGNEFLVDTFDDRESAEKRISAPAFAGAQQDKMKGCSKEAKGMKGDERKAFMKKCLSKDYTLKADAAPAEAKPVASAAAPAKQQDKMKSCNADAKTKALKGDERKKFMSSCLKG